MINFNQHRSNNYREVQDQLTSLVQKHLSPFSHVKSDAFYIKGALNFSWFIRLDCDVLMSHGVADKNYYWIRNKETGERYVNELKAILVPGEWMRSRVLNSPTLTLTPDQVISVGWPRLDYLREKQRLVEVPMLSQQISILWAPTHDKRKRGDEQKSTSSYPYFEPYAEMLSKRFKISASVHPRNRPDKEPTVDKLLRSNIVISDFGTLVYEAWALGKPVIFPRWVLKDNVQTYLPNSAEAFIFEHRIGYHPDSYEEMLTILCSEPKITPDVESFMEKYLDNYREGDSAKKIANTLLELDKLHNRSKHSFLYNIWLECFCFSKFVLIKSAKTIKRFSLLKRSK